MKKSITLLSLLIISTVILSSCRTIRAVPLAYTGNEEIEVAYINFQLYKKNEICGATYITYDNKNTPSPEKLCYWSPVEVPANTSIKLQLHIRYKEDRTDCGNDTLCAACMTSLFNAMEASRDVNKDIVFNVPPLEPDTEYTISYRKGPGIPGSSFVTLRRDDTNEVIRELEFN